QHPEVEADRRCQVAIDDLEARPDGVCGRHALVDDEVHRELGEEGEDDPREDTQSRTDRRADADEDGGEDHLAEILGGEDRADLERLALGDRQPAADDAGLDDEADQHEDDGEHDAGEQEADRPDVGYVFGVHRRERQRHQIPDEADGGRADDEDQGGHQDGADVLLELRPAIVERLARLDWNLPSWRRRTFRRNGRFAGHGLLLSVSRRGQYSPASASARYRLASNRRPRCGGGGSSTPPPLTPP